MAVVIKIGGSLFRDARALADVCNAVSTLRGVTALVAGGGALADQVRDMQSVHGFDDLAAHAMALRTMDINGLALSARIVRGVPVRQLSEFFETWSRGDTPVWLPSQSCDDDADLICDWSTTSDAIAARLCERLGCSGVVLLKSCAVDPSIDLNGLVRAGVVDSEFPKFVVRSDLQWRVIGLSDHARLTDVVASIDVRRSAVSDLVGAP